MLSLSSINGAVLSFEHTLAGKLTLFLSCVDVLSV